MLDGAFGAMDGIEGSSDLEKPPTNSSSESPGPSGPPSGPPSEAPGPSGPPSGPPSEAPAPSNPPSAPPSGPPSESPGPSGPPSGPPSEAPGPSGPPSDPPSESPGPSGPPSGPPSEALAPSSPPSTPPSAPLSEAPSNPPADTTEDSESVEETPLEEPKEEPDVVPETNQEEPTPPEEPTEVVDIQPDEEQPEEQPMDDPVQISETVMEPDNQEEIARLTAEIERLRSGLVGAAEVIEELEETPMPPIVFDNIVVPPHLVADFARMGRQLNRANLVKGSMGSMSMLHPDEPGLMISTRHSTSLARLDERGIVGGRLGGEPPRGAIADWKVHEVLLASVSVVTGGPAAAIHMHGPYTTAASCEKDLIIVQPIDVTGKEHIGKVVIVDPDGMDTDFLRQVAEALNQGGLRCVVVRGHGAYAVGANLDQAMANAAMLEHSMQILLLARQANLKF